MLKRSVKSTVGSYPTMDSAPAPGALLISPARGDLISVPSTGRAPLNGLVLRSGRNLRPGRYDEVLVNEPFAQIHGLEPGDRLSAVINGKLRDLLIVGHALFDSAQIVLAVVMIRQMEL